MQRFRSPLLALARLREQQQRQHELTLARLQQAFAADQLAIESLQSQANADLAAVLDASQHGVSGSEWDALHSHHGQQQQALAAQRVRLDQQAQQVQAAVERLHSAVAATKVVDRLLVERQLAHRREASRQDQLALDEQSTRHRIAMTTTLPEAR